MFQRYPVFKTYQREYGKLKFGHFIILAYQGYIFIFTFLVNIHFRFYNIIDNYITIPVSSSNNIHPSVHYGHPSNMKLESQKILEFFGQIEVCNKQKSRTECYFGGSGYDLVVSNALFAENNQQMNRTIYSQLDMATVGGTAHHLVERF